MHSVGEKGTYVASAPGFDEVERRDSSDNRNAPEDGLDRVRVEAMGGD